VTSTGADTRDVSTTAPRHRNVGDSALVTFLSRATAWILTAGGALGTVAAFALVLDRISLLKDPNFIPSCSISPLLSCGSIMTSPQAEVVGFPNPLIGVVAFPIVTTVGVVVLAGGTVPRSAWLGLQLGAAAGLVFVHRLIGQSLYSIGALCPYCMIVWVVTITVFWYVTFAQSDCRSPTDPSAMATNSSAHRALPQRDPQPLVPRDRHGDRSAILAVLGGAGLVTSDVILRSGPHGAR
jgi:uncharacterized membrane protein